jgi:hypothetical protein
MTVTGDFVTNQPVTFASMRRTLQISPIQEGVYDINDLKVIQRGAGANQSVDVGAGDGWVQVDSITGLCRVRSDATANVTISASHATLPRIDQLICRYNDTSIPTGSGNIPTLEKLDGTATSGATLDNRTGAAALPSNCLRLADILIPAASTSVVTANIRDRRPWTRGAYIRVIRTAGNLTTASGTPALLDATTLAPRLEVSSVPVRLTLRANISHTVANADVVLPFWMDGAIVDGLGANIGETQTSATATQGSMRVFTWDMVPAAGSHVFGPAFAIGTAGTLTVQANATVPLIFTVEELVRQNASNT